MTRTFRLVPALIVCALAACSKSDKPQDKAQPAAAASSKPAAAATTVDRKGSTSGAAESTAPANATPPAAGAAARIEVPEHAPRSADSGFRADKDGFKFQNYGNKEIPNLTNLTPDELKRLFGDQVCASAEGGHCTLSPAGQKWMERENNGMDGGHCEGFAALALLMKDHKVNAADFGGTSALDLKIADNPKLQREIALWFVTQSVQPTAGAEVKGLTPKQVVDVYADALAGHKEIYSLGFYKRGPKEGHAVTPYAVVDKGDDVQWLMVYDNNYPGQERHVEVNRKSDTWKYEGSTRPDVPPSGYEGDAETKTLTLTPSSARLVAQQCPFCGDIAATAPPETRGSRQVWLDGEAHLMIEDGAGHKLGFDGTSVVNTIPGASTTAFKNRELTNHDPIYFVPEGGSKLEITLDGSKLKKDAPSDVTLIAHGYTLAVQGVTLKPGQKDHVSFSKDFSEVKYKTDASETPAITLGIQTAGADYMMTIKVTGETTGQEIDLKIDLAAGTVSLFVHGKDATAKYDVTFVRIDPAKGPETFEHKGNSIAAADTVVFTYKDWKGPHQPMQVGTDKGGDGSVESTAPVSDQH